MTHRRLIAENHEFRPDGTAIIDMLNYSSACFVMEAAATGDTLTVEQGPNNSSTGMETFNDGIKDGVVTGAAAGEMLVVEARHPFERYIRAVKTGGVGKVTVMLAPRNVPSVTPGTTIIVSG